MSILIEEVSKQYGDQTALNKVSFSVNKGEIVGFLGPNGAGKSTLMKIITAYISADSGLVNVCGEHVYRKHKRQTTYWLFARTQSLVFGNVCQRVLVLYRRHV